jgi:hypothetical protein
MQISSLSSTSPSQDSFIDEKMNGPFETKETEAPSINEANLKYNKKGILLEPQPSDDPHDPLNFPRFQKYFILATLAYWAYLGTTNLIIVVCP